MARTVDVLVVGAGPTGLAAACTLRRAGVDVLTVDRQAAGANTSRAAVVHARTLEVLDELDVTRRLVAEGCVVPVFTMRDRTHLLARLDFSGLPTAHPYTLMLPQSRTEALLAERLGELGGELVRPRALTALTVSDDGAQATLDGPDGTQEVAARFVVGADGMHSTVREAVDIGFTGGRYAQSFVLADVRMRWPLPDDEVQLLLSPEGLVVVAPLPGGHHRVVATVDEAPADIPVSLVQSLLETRGPGGAHVDELVWASRFSVHHRVADTYRRGPVFLAGDAAHVHSPAGGQGMNTGIQDAVDLGGALAAALSGDTGALDGYERRRRPVAQDVVTLTDRATRMATLHSPVARLARNTLIRGAGHLPAVRRRLAMRIAELSTTQQI
jgi:2-polyprenyl-6-methoxyphenol hydroxylase-like FAD-dependent oxidoreductase